MRNLILCYIPLIAVMIFLGFKASPQESNRSRSNFSEEEWSRKKSGLWSSLVCFSKNVLVGTLRERIVCFISAPI